MPPSASKYSPVLTLPDAPVRRNSPVCTSTRPLLMSETSVAPPGPHLVMPAPGVSLVGPLFLMVSEPNPPMLCVTAGLFCSVQVPVLLMKLRSEERRVGKECRSVRSLLSVRETISSGPLIASVPVGATTVVPPQIIVPPGQLGG